MILSSFGKDFATVLVVLGMGLYGVVIVREDTKRF
ncbi:hypothetical protein SOVF_145850 [Spinacia oleracea]|nr:hypothetical protein SOVF_145850 [Spinacia oleracea]